MYSGIYSEEKLLENTAVFTEVKDTVKNFFIDIHSGVPSGEMNVRIKLLNGQYRWYHFKYSSIFHQGKPVSAMISIYAFLGNPQLLIITRNDVAISCSIGCTIEQENSTYESLYHQADLALYQVKKNGKNNFAFYSPDFGEDNPKSS